MKIGYIFVILSISIHLWVLTETCRGGHLHHHHHLGLHRGGVKNWLKNHKGEVAFAAGVGFELTDLILDLVALLYPGDGK